MNESNDENDQQNSLVNKFLMTNFSLKKIKGD